MESLTGQLPKSANVIQPGDYRQIFTSQVTQEHLRSWISQGIMNSPPEKVYKNWQFTATFRTKAVGSIRSTYRSVSSLLTQSLRPESIFLIESRRQKLMSYQAGRILSFCQNYSSATPRDTSLLMWGAAPGSLMSMEAGPAKSILS